MPLTMWTPYSERTGRRPDFRVRYRFFTAEEGGRPQPPVQGYRSDFLYEGENLQRDGCYMIYPEFLNADGSVMLEEQTIVPSTGEAYMWILFHEDRHEYHRKRALPGQRGWFLEGSRKVAEVTILEQIALAEPQLGKSGN